jgi:hypothetical protein
MDGSIGCSEVYTNPKLQLQATCNVFQEGMIESEGDHVDGQGSFGIAFADAGTTEFLLLANKRQASGLRVEKRVDVCAACADEAGRFAVVGLVVAFDEEVAGKRVVTFFLFFLNLNLFAQ